MSFAHKAKDKIAIRLASVYLCSIKKLFFTTKFFKNEKNNDSCFFAAKLECFCANASKIEFGSFGF